MELLEKLKEYLETYESDIQRLANELRKEKMPILTDELYAEFELNGNRTRFETKYFKKREFLAVFALASLIWHKKEDIEKLEEVIKDICMDKTWVLPAHVKKEIDVNIDLFSSETAQSLAHICDILKDELSEDVKQMVKNEVFARVLTPFISSDENVYWWEKDTHNWNAVCCGNVGSAGLLMLAADEEKKKLCERIQKAIINGYLEGFGEDGACPEGMGYWTYGLTYMMLFAIDQKRFDPSSDIMANDKVKKIAQFQQQCYFYGGTTVTFADGGSSLQKYSMGLTCALADIYGDIRFPDPKYAQKMSELECSRWVGSYWSWYWTKKYIEDVEEGKLDLPKNIEPVHVKILPDVQWCIMQGNKNSTMIAKGGDNDEPHNHNDVASFIYMADGEVFLEDLGAGEYTKKYFSTRRYEIFCNRGMSHNILVIDGVDQKDGREYRADKFELEGEDTIKISFAKAYGLASVYEAVRRISLEEATGNLTVSDCVRVNQGTPVCENLITRMPVSIEEDRVVIKGKKHNAILSASGKEGGFKVNVVDHSNHSGNLEKINVITWKTAENKDNDGEEIIDSRFYVEIADC